MTETIDTADAVMTSETSLRVERSYDALPEEVFDAWTNPEVLRRWWAVHPEGTTPIAEVDLREGGRYRLSMEGPDGERHTVQGEYSEVDRPHRLVYSWRWEARRGRARPGQHRERRISSPRRAHDRRAGAQRPARLRLARPPRPGLDDLHGDLPRAGFAAAA